MCLRYRSYNLRLVGHLSQHARNFLVSFNKPELGVLQTLLFGVLLHNGACGAEVVSREPREEVVRHLQVQAAVDELYGRRANYVYGRSELACKEGFRHAEVCSRT